MKTIDISYPVLGKLISEHGEPSHICINVFWKIWHSVVSIFHNICNQFRIFSVILELAVVFNFFALRHMDLPRQHWFRLKSSMQPTQTCSGLSVQDPALSVSYYFLLLVPASMLLHSQSPLKYCWIQILRDSTPFLWHQFLSFLENLPFVSNSRQVQDLNSFSTTSIFLFSSSFDKRLIAWFSTFTWGILFGQFPLLFKVYRKLHRVYFESVHHTSFILCL